MLEPHLSLERRRSRRNLHYIRVASFRQSRCKAASRHPSVTRRAFSGNKWPPHRAHCLRYLPSFNGFIPTSHCIRILRNQSTPPPTQPTLWIASPNAKSSSLSSDIECLKWQTYLSLRKVPNVALRWDVQPDGGVNGVLPSLHLPSGDLLGVPRIPAWADSVLSVSLDDLEGYRTSELRDESRAWITLFEGDVHAALVSLNRGIQVGTCQVMPYSIFSSPS